MKTSKILVVVGAASLAFSACGGSDKEAINEPAVPITEAPSSTTAAAAPAPSALSGNYCDNVKKALAVKPGQDSEGQITPQVEAQYRKYVDALGPVVATAPAESKEYWQSLLTVSKGIATGNATSPEVNDAGPKLFDLVGAAAAEVKRNCNVDIA